MGFVGLGGFADFPQDFNATRGGLANHYVGRLVLFLLADCAVHYVVCGVVVKAAAARNIDNRNLRKRFFPVVGRRFRYLYERLKSQGVFKFAKSLYGLRFESLRVSFFAKLDSPAIGSVAHES